MTSAVLRQKAIELVDIALALAKKHDCYESVVNSSVTASPTQSKIAAYLQFIVLNWSEHQLESSLTDEFPDDELWAYLCDGFRVIGQIERGQFSPKVEELLQKLKSGLAKKAAEARHSAPGGARDKAQAIRDAWASGKYSSRDICAEQESAALGMSFSTARKALRGVPAPCNATKDEGATQ